MKALSLLAVVMAFLSGPLAAHPGHDDPLTRDAAVKRASAEITRLVGAGKLHESWKVKSTMQAAELWTKGASREWAVVFANPQAPDEAQRTLYIFLTEHGEYVAANFTGR